MPLPCRELALLTLLLIDDARDSEEELLNWPAEAHKAIVVLLDSLQIKSHS
jgi:hypothetical protein